MLQSPVSPRLEAGSSFLKAVQSSEERKMFTSDLRHRTFLCSRTEIPELGLENEEGPYLLSHCALHTISKDILRVNSLLCREQVQWFKYKGK